MYSGFTCNAFFSRHDSSAFLRDRPSDGSAKAAQTFTFAFEDIPLAGECRSRCFFRRHRQPMQFGFESSQDNYFGGCPICGKNEGYINVGSDHYCICTLHKKAWYVGSNLFSSCKDETKEEQQAVWDKLGMDDYEQVDG
jgi:hypothetical protein